MFFFFIEKVFLVFLLRDENLNDYNQMDVFFVIYRQSLLLSLLYINATYGLINHRRARKQNP